ncbi:MAG TPA: T9SS type A sorting domain-containing protein [bacterium]|nr:T9SS type A sorting domain-containing protein [bacterium]
MRNSLRDAAILTLGLLAAMITFSAAKALNESPFPSTTFTPLRLEAESGQSTEMTLLADAKASGGRYLRGLSPGKVQWKFNLAAAGWYTLTFNHQAPDGESICQFARNGLSSGVGFGWADQWYRREMVFKLQAGENTLELTCGANTLDLDYIEIDTAAVQPEMTPVNNIFYLAEPRDLVAKLDLYGRTLTGVASENHPIRYTLAAYPWQEDTWRVRLAGADLAKLTPGEHTLALTLDSGEPLRMYLTVVTYRAPALLTLIVPHIFHGNAVLVIFPTGKTLLVDCADATQREAILIPLLRRNGIEHLDYFFLTHYHGDHDGGDRGAAILSEFEVDRYEDNRTLAAGQILELEGARIQIRNAFSGGSDENAESLAFQLKYRDFVYVHDADIYGSNQSAIMNGYANDLRGHVLFGNHHFHGSSNADYMRAVDPFIVLLQAEQAIYARSAWIDVFCKQTAAWLRAQHKRFIEAVPALEVGTVVIRADDGENWSYETYGDTLVPRIPYLLANNHHYEDAHNAPVFTHGPDSLITSYTGSALLEYRTDKTAALRFAGSDLPYAEMTNDFTLGQGQILHHTRITGRHGETKTLYVRAMDHFGNESAASARCTVVFDSTARPLPWHHPDYPDAGWQSGAAPLGYGDTSNRTTTARVRTLYLRKSFTLTESVKAMGLLLKGRDGLIAYLNGVEIARLNMQEGPLSYADFALSAPAKPYANVIVLDQAGLGALRIGENILALEVHSAERTDPSISGDARLFSNTAIYSDLNQSWSYLDSGSDPPALTFKDVGSGVQSDPQRIPIYCTLRAAWPNPFNAATAISFRLENRAHVSLAVYNRLGQHVVQLLSGEMPEGWHKTIWQADDYPSGIYFIRLDTEQSQKTIKTALLR